jgi:hypothetical protein
MLCVRLDVVLNERNLCNQLVVLNGAIYALVVLNGAQ